MNEALTVNQLYEALQQAVKAGLGEKKILLTTDDEGNGLHECFFAVNPITQDCEYMSMPFNLDIDEAIAQYVMIG